MAPISKKTSRSFYNSSKQDLVGFLETKIKLQNIAPVMGKICPTWNWIHNASEEERGRIIVSWHPRHYQFNLLHIIDQMIHKEVVQLTTSK